MLTPFARSYARTLPYTQPNEPSDAPDMHIAAATAAIRTVFFFISFLCFEVPLYTLLAQQKEILHKTCNNLKSSFKIAVQIGCSHYCGPHPSGREAENHVGLGAAPTLHYSQSA